MEFPLELRSALESKAAAYSTATLQKTVRDLSDRYRCESGDGRRLLTTDQEAVAYAAVRMPATFGAVSAALSYALPFTAIPPTSLLDVGAGTGTAAWAASAQLNLSTITCIEREPAMRRLGKALMETGSAILQKTNWTDCDLTANTPLPQKADLVISSYVLNEMKRADRRSTALRLWEATENLLLIVEPGTPIGSAGLREVRDLLLQQGAHIAAPCPTEDTCPLCEGDWCHFSCRLARSKLHKQLKGGDVPYEDEKFSYLALSRSPCNRAEARILRHPYIEPGKITLELCTAHGLDKTIVRKRDGALFKQARKSEWGFPFF